MAVDTGGVDIGTWGGVGGELPGLNTISKLALRAPEWQELARQARQPAKDYNDRPVPFMVGSDTGQPVFDAGFIPPL